MLRNATTIAPTLARGIATAALLASLLAACSPPSPPEEERRPEPQADAPARSGLVQAADAYKDRARGAAAQQQDAADRQRAELAAATQ